MSHMIVRNLLRLMCLPSSRFAGVIRTADGFYIARKKGDLGYNTFLGKPSPLHDGPGRKRMLQVWNSMTPEERQEVTLLAAHPMDGSPILLEKDFGVPISEILEGGLEPGTENPRVAT